MVLVVALLVAAVTGVAATDQITASDRPQTINADTLDDTVAPRSGNPPDVDIIEGGAGGDQVNVADGDALDWVCPGPGGDDVVTDLNLGESGSCID